MTAARLLEAARAGDQAEIEALLARGVKGNSKHLVEAARAGETDVVDVLLRSGTKGTRLQLGMAREAEEDAVEEALLRSGTAGVGGRLLAAYRRHDEAAIEAMRREGALSQVGMRWELERAFCNDEAMIAAALLRAGATPRAEHSKTGGYSGYQREHLGYYDPTDEEAEEIAAALRKDVAEMLAKFERAAWERRADNPAKYAAIKDFMDALAHPAAAPAPPAPPRTSAAPSKQSRGGLWAALSIAAALALLLALVTCGACPAPAAKADPPGWRYMETIDGDTLEFAVPALPAPLARVLVRVREVDTPETRRPKREWEHEKGSAMLPSVRRAFAFVGDIRSTGRALPGAIHDGRRVRGAAPAGRSPIKTTARAEPCTCSPPAAPLPSTAGSPEPPTDGRWIPRTALAGELQRAGLDVVFRHVEAAHPMAAWAEALMNAGPVEEAEAGNAAP